MILPIVAYGDPVLRKLCDNITPEYEGLQELIKNMFDTMHNAEGVGLAAPQVNKVIRLFIVETKGFAEDEEEEDDAEPEFTPEERKKLINFSQVFINPVMVDETGEEWPYREGCLSIPKIREDVMRKPQITLKYLDEKFVEHQTTFDGLIARVIQHEYDHIEGKLFIDYLTQLKRRLIKKKLDDISAGKVKTDYRMLFPR